MKALTETMRLWGLFNQKYPDFLWNSDAVVPLKSQLSGLPLTAANVSIIPNTKQTDLSRFHVGVQGKTPTIDRVYQLMNKSIHDIEFGYLEGNNYPQKTLSSVSNIASLSKETVPKALVNNNPYEVFDDTKIKITSPAHNSMAAKGSILSIKIAALDTVNLKRVELLINGDNISYGGRQTSYEFQYDVSNLIAFQQTKLLAIGYYYIDNEYYLKLDSISIAVTEPELVNNFEANPNSIALNLEEEFRPLYVIQYYTKISTDIDQTKLSVSISNPTSLGYNTQTGKFTGLQKGDAVVIFTYDGIFKDTMYVAVAGGGQPYPQTITTNSLPISTVCTGQMLQVPFTTSGGSFDTYNEFQVQISDNNGENFYTIASGANSPINIKIPNDLVASSGYKVRVVSTNVPVIGTESATNLTITSFGTPPTVSASKTTFWSGESVTLIASSCPSGQTIKWSSGQTSNQIVVTPSESTVYTAVCTNGTCETQNSQPIFISKNYCPIDYVKNTNSSTGNNIYKASQSIEATHKITGSGTREQLEAPATILKPGFETQMGVIFSVQVGGCNN